MARKDYTAEDITVLEGLEPVRKRPAMYIGGVGKEGLHHLVWEIVDNSVDEAMNGHARQIDVWLSKDGKTVRVTDDGRGIPVDMHKKAKKPAVEVILTTLHSGAKFDRKNYATAGGLHGVGASVVNALAEELKVTIHRDGEIYEQTYSRGHPTSKLRTIGKDGARTGTTVEFRADPEIFDKTDFDPELIKRSLDDRSFVHRGVKFTFTDESTGQTETFLAKEGLKALLERALTKRNLKPTSPIFTLEKKDDPRIEIALAWATDATYEDYKSYVNGIHTDMGGTHEAGLKSAIARAVKDYMTTHDVKTVGLKVSNEDIREGVLAIVSIFLHEPQFQGQTKSRLNNPEVQGQVEQALKPALERWFTENKSIADAVIARILMAARARAAAREAATQVRAPRGARGHNLPEKIADCSSSDPESCEIFIVEGQSAGGTAKLGRDRKIQAILPVRGKVLNAEQATIAKVLENKELNDIVRALGCGVGDQVNLANLRYHKVILLMDADADGEHITTLLLTFFFRYMPALVRGGHVFIAKPPLFKVDWNKQKFWAANDEELKKVLASLPKNAKPEVSRFKGLGEMASEILKETTLDPARRTLVRVEVGDEPLANQAVMELMGKDVEARFNYIMTEAPKVSDLDV